MTHNRINTPDKQLIQLNQKLLHFRSEVVKQERLLTEKTKRLLQQDQIIDSLTDRLEELTKQPTIIQQEEHMDSSEPVKEPIGLSFDMHCYFTYSIMAPFEVSDDEPFLIKGNFVIENRGDLSFQEPVICLSFNKPEYANLSGRIERSKNKASQYSVSREGVTESWSFVEEKADQQAKKTGQFWLKSPINEIPPQSTILFPDFEVVIPMKKEQKSISLQLNGFLYGAELTEGKPSLNTIALTLS
ncbi:hypothetical protein JOC54_003635 [Alkalihalobacillus xiaoxiensis]|uniref:Uncharacterized protein n=1 Tax=Shouchella xiaoxiensis TaxID=766895 RepID=A0ABS2T0W6_9BACI|nr:hypothetical protein [Shouchella xiaoxiensis]MBM7840354.1 hypothetical protein [Shouchella xiaoxiensis]